MAAAVARTAAVAGAAAAAGARPVRQYVLKVAGRCDLACDHCYVYEGADQGWRTRPSLASPATVAATARRIAEHADAHRLDDVAVILHGGEPLLAGARRLDAMLGELRSAIEPVTTLHLSLQSNGVRLDPELCEVLAAHGVRVGISLDGDEEANDRHRRFASGAGSHGRVTKALDLLRTAPFRALYGGILCTVDLANDPVDVYRALVREEPPRIDLLLPHATWDAPPPRPPGRPAAYGDWLLRVFDRWDADGRPVPIRTFDSVLALLRGEGSGTEALGPDGDTVLVVETDGTWERPDSLKVVAEDAARTGLDVFSAAVDDVVGAGGPALTPAPGAQCRACPVFAVCGGGLLAHRAGRGRGYDNPSVYCDDLFALVRGIEQRTRDVDPGPDPGLGVGAGVGVRVGVGVGVGGLEPDDERLVLDVAAGRWSDASSARLADLQYALDRILLGRVAAADPGAGWELLVELERAAPRAVRSAVTDPFVRAAAHRSLRAAALGAGPDRAGAGPLLAAVAAAAAVRAGVPARVDLPVRHGSVTLPGLGSFDLDAGSGSGPVTVLTVTGDGGAGVPGGPGRWRPLRPGPQGSGLHLDDASPDRDLYRVPVTGRLAAGPADELLTSVADEVRRLRGVAPGPARGLAALVRVVVPVRPVRPVRPGRTRVTGHRQAFGALAVPVPADGTGGPGGPGGSDGPFGRDLVRAVADLTVVGLHDVVELFRGEAAVAAVRRLARAAGALAVAEAGRAAGSERPAAAVDPDVDRLADDPDRLADDLDRLAAGPGARAAAPTAAGRLLVAGLRERVGRGWPDDAG